MEGSVSNVQFTERKRGFDPDEVANYLHQIDDKIAGLRSMASEAVERAEIAEERARQAEREAAQASASAATGSGDDDAARAASVLAMAQRTADATVSEARTEAARLLAVATTEASQQSAATEAQSQQMLADARREMEAARTEHLDALRLEVSDLERSRDAIVAEIGVLTQTLDAERSRLRQAAAALLDMADSPAGIAGLAGGGHSDGTIDGTIDIASGDSGSVSHSDNADDHSPSATLHQPENADDDLVEEDVVIEEAAVDEIAVDEIAADESVVDEIAMDEIVVDDAVADGIFTGEVVIEATDPDATAALSGLFDDDDDDESAGIDGEAPIGGVTDPSTGGGYADSYGAGRVSGESSLGPVADADDAAMRAFFERDEDEGGNGSRWGRRRR
jgi:cell division septum initiation protein DivIVA